MFGYGDKVVTESETGSGHIGLLFGGASLRPSAMSSEKIFEAESAVHRDSPRFHRETPRSHLELHRAICVFCNGFAAFLSNYASKWRFPYFRERAYKADGGR